MTSIISNSSQDPTPLTSILGEGGAAVVETGKDPKTGSPIAKKFFNEKRLAQSEVDALKGTQEVLHRMQWRRKYFDDERGKVCLDLDRIYEKNVFDAFLKYGKRLQLEAIKSIACQLFEFCDGMERAGYQHRDLSPDNMIWEWKSRKLTVIDFGASYKIGSLPRNVTTTSFRYAPPELILEKEATSSFDLWSVGCVLFELITGESLCDYMNLSSVQECYQYTLQQIVTQIGTPSLEYLKECKARDRCFVVDDGNIILVKKWESPETLCWKDVIWESLAERSVPQEEIDQWIDLLDRLLSYENRGRASEHLARPLFSSEVKLKLIYNTDIKCKIVFCRAVTHSENPGRADLVIDLQTQKDHRCVHVPRDPNDLYEVFITDDKNVVQLQMTLHSGFLDITSIQESIQEASINPTPEENTE